MYKLRRNLRDIVIVISAIIAIVGSIVGIVGILYKDPISPKLELSYITKTYSIPYNKEAIELYIKDKERKITEDITGLKIRFLNSGREVITYKHNKEILFILNGNVEILCAKATRATPGFNMLPNPTDYKNKEIKFTYEDIDRGEWVEINVIFTGKIDKPHIFVKIVGVGKKQLEQAGFVVPTEREPDSMKRYNRIKFWYPMFWFISFAIFFLTAVVFLYSRFSSKENITIAMKGRTIKVLSWTSLCVLCVFLIISGILIKEYMYYGLSPWQKSRVPTSFLEDF